MQNKPLLLIVLDGWGCTEATEHNAIATAHTPVWKKLWNNYPHTMLSASGFDVGLPDGQMGNSEVGHMTLGSGRVIFQDLTRINNAIADQTFFDNKTLLEALQYAKQQNKAVHILGLLSPGGVHSHEQQILALLKMAQQQVSQTYVHAFLDGRDTPPKSARASLQKVPNIVSLCGRFYAMDRDKRLERTEAAIDLLVNAKAKFNASDPITGLEMAYARGETDEFVQPTIIKSKKIQEGDVVIFMNFRSDRARQLSNALIAAVPNLHFLTLTEYDPNISAKVIFPKQQTNNTLGEILEKHGLRQLRIAETEKYAHVTFFFNAGRETAFNLEERILIPSPKVATYDLHPEMSTSQITDYLLKVINDKSFDVIICNFANADMVGHTGNFAATIEAIQTIDHCLGKILNALEQFGGQALITADHGNAEFMWDAEAKQPYTAHTTNLVPLLYVGPQKILFKDNKIYGLQDVAPTILELLNIEKPNDMRGVSLLNHK